MLSAILKSADTVAKSSEFCLSPEQVLRIVAMYQAELEKNSKVAVQQSIADAVEQVIQEIDPHTRWEMRQEELSREKREAGKAEELARAQAAENQEEVTQERRRNPELERRLPNIYL